MVRKVRHKKDFDSIIQSRKKVIVLFMVNWMGLCKTMSQYFDEINERYRSITFITVDVDESVEIAEEHNIEAMPMFKMYKDGVFCEEMVSSGNEAGLQALLNRYA